MRPNVLSPDSFICDRKDHTLAATFSTVLALSAGSVDWHVRGAW